MYHEIKTTTLNSKRSLALLSSPNKVQYLNEYNQVGVMDLVRYGILKQLLLLESKDIDPNKYSSELKETKGTDPNQVLKMNLSKLVSPEKLSNIISSDIIKDTFPNINYDHSTKTLTVGDSKLDGGTKLLVLFYITIYYLLQSREGIDSVSSTYIEKSLEILKGVFTSKTILSEYEINAEVIDKIFGKTIGSNPIFGLICYVVGIALFDKRDGGTSTVSHIVKMMQDTNDIFGTRLYYVLLKLKDTIPNNVYVNSLADIVYNELFANGIVQTPLSIIKMKAVTSTSGESSSDSTTTTTNNNNSSSTTEDQKSD